MYAVKQHLLFLFTGSVLVIIFPLTLYLVSTRQNLTQHAAGITTLGRYQKFEITFPYSGNFSNPNDPSEADLEGIFTAPSGKKLTVPGFYYEGYQNDNPTGEKDWKVRFAPSELGNYTYTITLKTSGGNQTLGTGSFSVTPSNSHGFVRASGVTYVFDDGTGFYPIGINVIGFHADNKNIGPWNWGTGFAGVDNAMNILSQNGMNFFAMWTCSWNIGQQPYARPNIGCDSNGDDNNIMDQKDSALIDYMVQQAENKNIYWMPTLKHHHQTWDIPHDPIKERYFIARWGYSTSILAWDADKESAVDPTAEKAYTTFMVQTDPYQHLRTTNQWNNFPTLGSQRLSQYNAVFSDPDMTLVNNHDYMQGCNTDLQNDTSLYYYSIFSGNDPRNSQRFNKPNMNGEGGLDDCGTNNVSALNTNDTNGIVLKGYSWGTFMSTLCGCTPWWYTKQQLAGFKGLGEFIKALPLVPPSANGFTTYQDTSQATTSDPKLRVIGRKNQTFAMAYIQNTTGTWAAILRDNQTPQPTGGSITLKNMSGNFTVKWFDTQTGSLIKTETVSTNGNGLILTLPQTITQSIAVFATTDNSPSITPFPSVTTPPSPTVPGGSTPFSVTVCPHDLGNCGDNVNPNSGGNTNLKHLSRSLTVIVLDTTGQTISSAQGSVLYNPATQNFANTISLSNIQSGIYLVSLKMDGFLAKQLQNIISVTKGQSVTLPQTTLITGDINNDNQLDILDYNILISCFGLKVNTSTCTSPPSQSSPGADINDDGAIDGVDYNEFLRELSVQKGSQ